MEAMQSAGLPAKAVLVASTRGGALAMGRLEELGTLEPGKAADLIAVAGDPTADIAHLRRLRWVVRGGEARPIEETQQRYADEMGAPQCGLAAANPFLPWFGEAAEHVRSMALIPLGQTSVFGLLALGSEDAKRFFPEMGTLYLRRIGELCAAGVTARL